MATTTYELGASNGSLGFLARLRATIADYRLYRATLAELEALTDRELGDLGLSRLTIRQVAHNSVYSA